MAEKKILSGVSPAAYGSAPYGDQQEVTGPPVFESVLEPPREFLGTDARTVMIVLHPNHYNFFKNPSFRANSTGWETTGVTGVALDPNDSWVGQSMRMTGTGTLRYRDGAGNFVYVGPSRNLDQLDWYEPGRGAAQWTFSAYFKGDQRLATGPFDPPARVRLVMHAYRASDPLTAGSPPANTSIPTVADPSASTTAADPLVVGGNGNVWERREPPFYRVIGDVPLSAVDPLTIVATGPFPPALEPWLRYGTSLYKVKPALPETAGQSYYTNVGVPTTVTADPRTALPGASYTKLNSAGDPRHGQYWELAPPPYYRDTGERPWFAEVEGQWYELSGDEWQRVRVRTDAWSQEGEGRVSFEGCAWIDAYVEVENCAEVKVSSLMLDPTENPYAQYFDGSMTEDPAVDDFIWSKTQADYTTPLENQCVSYYYYDRKARTRWLYENLKYVVPVDRPYQIFYGAYDRPYFPPSQTQVASRNVLSI